MNGHIESSMDVQNTYIKEDDMRKKKLQPLTPAALYARVSSGRLDMLTRR